LSDPPIRLWSGYWVIEFDVGGGQLEEFQPIGDRGLAQVTGGALGGSEQNMTLTLSGIEPEALAVLDAGEVESAPVTVWRMIFKGDGKTFLDAHVCKRGRVDEVPVEDVIGGAATIAVLVEGAARGLGRRGGRMRSDSDQRLVQANDGFFRNVSFAGEKNLYWGGRKPAIAGAALGGVWGGGGGMSRDGGFSAQEQLH
jgi:hypothetical protein